MKEQARLEVFVGEVLFGNKLRSIFDKMLHAQLAGKATYKVQKNAKEFDAVFKEQRDVIKKLIADTGIVEPDIKSIQKQIELAGDDKAKVVELIESINKANKEHDDAIFSNEKIKEYLNTKVFIDFPNKFTPSELEVLEYDNDSKKYYTKCIITAAEMAVIEPLIEG